MKTASISLPYTQRATRIFTGLRQKSPQAEVHHLLRRMDMSRPQLITEISQELLTSVSNLAVALVEDGVSLSDGHPELDQRIGPVVHLFNILRPRDYDFDRQVLYTALERYHMGTFFHSVLRVNDAAMKMANYFRISCGDRTKLVLASRFHDIGKIAVPLSILDKPETLNCEERKVMDLHQSIGYLLLRGIERFRQVAEVMAFTHVEQGYPEEFLSRKVPFLSHILIIADTFDACLSYREYRANHRMPLHDVFKIVVQHENPRHPLEILIAAARAYEINPDDAKAILGSVFTSGDELGQIEEAFG